MACGGGEGKGVDAVGVTPMSLAGGGAAEGSGGGKESFLLVAGSPQSGKSTLVAQFLTPGKGALAMEDMQCPCVGAVGE